MKPQSLIVVLFASLAITTTVSAEHGGTKPAAEQPEGHSASVEMEVDSLVAGRRAAYWMSAGLFGGMFGVINNGGDVKPLEFPARALAGWAKALPGMFPEGSVNEKSNALPTVWSEREDFEQLAAQYADRAAELAEVAKTGDAEAFKTQWGLVRQSCSSCHDKFRRDRKKEAHERE